MVSLAVGNGTRDKLSRQASSAHRQRMQRPASPTSNPRAERCCCTAVPLLQPLQPRCSARRRHWRRAIAPFASHVALRCHCSTAARQRHCSCTLLGQTNDHGAGCSAALRSEAKHAASSRRLTRMNSADAGSRPTSLPSRSRGAMQVAPPARFGANTTSRLGCKGRKKTDKDNPPPKSKNKSSESWPQKPCCTPRHK